MKKPDAVYLEHLLAAIARCERYAQGLTYEQFAGDDLRQDGIIRQLESIGEAARQVSPDLQALHSEVPWSDLVGIRNKLIHAYFEVNLAIVWDTVRFDLPMLKAQVERILALSTR